MQNNFSWNRLYCIFDDFFIHFGERVIPPQIIQGMSPLCLRFSWNLDHWQIWMKKDSSENLSVTAIAVQEISLFKIWPIFSFRSQNPPFWIYLFGNNSGNICPIDMKICIQVFFGVRNSKTNFRNCQNYVFKSYCTFWVWLRNLVPGPKVGCVTILILKKISYCHSI